MKNRIVFKDNCIEKRFRSVISFDNELKVYEIMAGSGLVPALFSCTEKCLVLEKLKGQNLADAIWQPDERLMFANAQRRRRAFCDFQQYYFSKTGRYLVNRDSNLKNFVIDGDEVKLIDFENSYRGDFVQAAGRFLAPYVSENDLMYECYEKACNVIKEYFPHVDINEAGVIARTEFSAAMRRRKLMPAIRKAALCIAAGGKSSRMGTDKGLLPIGGYSICDNIIYNLSIFDNIIISANNSDYSRFGLPVYNDEHSDKGPLSAIYTAVKNRGTDWVMLCRCDMPFVNRDVVYTLFENIADKRQVVVITCKGRPYPVLALYHKSVFETVKQQIESGNYKLRVLLDKLETVYVEYPDEKRLVNMNTPEDYKNII